MHWKLIHVFAFQLSNILNSLEQKLDPTATNVARALFPLAVRWASTFMQKSDIQ